MSTFAVQIQSIGPLPLPAGSIYVSTVINNTVNPQVTEVNLLNGDNTITVPTGGYVSVTIQPAPSNTVLFTLKGNAADTGVALHKTNATQLSLNSTQTTFILTSGGGTSAGWQFTWI